MEICFIGKHRINFNIYNNNNQYSNCNRKAAGSVKDNKNKSKEYLIADSPDNKVYSIFIPVCRPNKRCEISKIRELKEAKAYKAAIYAVAGKNP